MDIRTLAHNPNISISFNKLYKDIGNDDHTITSDNGTRKIKAWGEVNRLPIEREMLLMDNNIMLELLATIRSIVLGSGIKMFEKSKDKDGKSTLKVVDFPEEIQAFMDNSDFPTKYEEEGINQLLIHANIPVSFITSNDGTMINSMMSYKCRDIRAEMKQKFGENINGFYWGDYSEKNKKSLIYKYIKSMPPLRDISQKKFRGEGILWVSDNMIHDGYYAHPRWWGAKEWILLANKIPVFHLNNIANGYLVRYHVEIPNDSFLDQEAFDAATTEEEINKCKADQKRARQEFMDAIDKFLAGEENVGKALYTFFKTDETGKKLDGVTINSVPVDLKDESLIKLYEKAIQSLHTASGLHPTLANVEQSGKLSSGSEMKAALNTWIQIKAPIFRKKLLEPLKYLLKYNGWDVKYPNLIWGFEDIVLVNMDDEKKGFKELTKETAE